MLKLFKNEFNSHNWSGNSTKDAELTRLDRLLKEQIKEKFSSKLRLYILDTGSCNGCELELQALFNSLYNISSLGIEVVYDVTKTDILLLTGLMNENMYAEVQLVYEKLREPKRVITLGDCPVGQAPFRDTFALKSQAINSLPIAYHITGCPPDPKEILRALLKYLKNL